MLYLSRHAQKPNARYRIFSRWVQALDEKKQRKKTKKKQKNTPDTQHRLSSIAAHSKP